MIFCRVCTSELIQSTYIQINSHTKRKQKNRYVNRQCHICALKQRWTVFFILLANAKRSGTVFSFDIDRTNKSPQIIDWINVSAAGCVTSRVFLCFSFKLVFFSDTLKNEAQNAHATYNEIEWGIYNWPFCARRSLALVALKSNTRSAVYYYMSV